MVTSMPKAWGMTRMSEKMMAASRVNLSTGCSVTRLASSGVWHIVKKSAFERSSRNSAQQGIVICTSGKELICKHYYFKYFQLECLIVIRILLVKLQHKQGLFHTVKSAISFQYGYRKWGNACMSVILNTCTWEQQEWSRVEKIWKEAIQT